MTRVSDLAVLPLHGIDLMRENRGVKRNNEMRFNNMHKKSIKI